MINKNRPTLGGGVKVSDGEYGSQELDSTVAILFRYKFNQKELDAFITEYAYKVREAVRTKEKLEIILPDDKSQWLVACHYPRYIKANEEHILNNYKAFLDLFDESYSNKYYEDYIIVFSAFGIELTEKELDLFINKHKDDMPRYIEKRKPFCLDIKGVKHIDAYSVGFNPNSFTSRELTNNKTNQDMIDAKKIFDLFDPSFFNKYYGLEDKTFIKACKEAEHNKINNEKEFKEQYEAVFTGGHSEKYKKIDANSISDEDYNRHRAAHSNLEDPLLSPYDVKNNQEDYHTLETCKDQENFDVFNNGTSYEQAIRLKETLIEFRPEDKNEIELSPISYVTQLIKKFNNTQNEVDDAIKSKEPVVLIHSEALSLINELENDSTSEHYKGNK